MEKGEWEPIYENGKFIGMVNKTVEQKMLSEYLENDEYFWYYFVHGKCHPEHQKRIDEQEKKQRQEAEVLEKELELLKQNIQSCPVCGATNIAFKHKVTQGHGDSQFSVRCVCDKCKTSIGCVKRLGTPITQDEINAIKEWNKTILKHKKQDGSTQPKQD